MDLSHFSSPNDNFKLIYSPRTTYDSLKSSENKLYIQLLQSFDKKTLSTLRRHFKEHLGSITKDLFICILKMHISLNNQEIKNKNKILIKLLSKLFDEIDLDSNEIINWNEFANFLANFNGGKTIKKYYLKKYYESKININPLEKIKDDEDNDFHFHNSNKDKVSYCFYIEKYRFLGLIKEGDSKIIFFNTETNKRLKLEIDFTLIEKEIDKYALYQLDEKIDYLLEKKEEEYLNHKAILEEKRRILMLKRNKRYNSNSKEKDSNSNEKNKSEIENNLPNKNRLNKSTNAIKDISIDKNNKSRNILSYKNINTIANGINKKSYHIATNLFLDEYNLLLISTTDNIISAWKYKEREDYFENVNLINHNIENIYNKKKCVFDKDKILIHLLKTEHTQYSMCFDYLTNNLYTGQTDGKILKWDLTLNHPILILDINDFKEKNNLTLPILEASNNAYQKEIKDVALKIGQSDFNKVLKSLPEKKRIMISCLILISPLKLLCSAHYNGLIVLWDLVYSKPKRIFNDQKTGIYQVLYNYKMNHLYTCGFEHDIFVYDPYIEKEAIYKLKGHKSSINSIALISKNNELISIDISGIIKIWDITNFFNFQTININDAALLKANNVNEREELYNKIYKKKISANLHIQTFPDLSKFLIYGKKFILFEKGNCVNPELCDDYKIIGCFYNPKTNNIVTISHKKVQFWNILNGKLIKIFRDLMTEEKISKEENTQRFENANNININYDITAYAYDIHYKKIFLGDSTGRIKSFSLESGDLIKQFESHKEEITDIIYSFKFDYLITCSTDLIIKFHKDNETLNESNKPIREYELVYEKLKNQIESKINKIIVRKIVLNEEKNLLIICLNNGFIKELDIEFFKFINEIDCLNLNIKFDNIKNISLISSAEYIRDINIIFITLENNDKQFVALKYNKYFNLLSGKDIFINENNIEYNNNLSDDHQKNIIECCYYDEKMHKIFIGNSMGELTCYDLSQFCKYFLDNNGEKKWIENIIKNGVDIDFVYKNKINNEPINFIIKPQLLNPEILIVLSIEKTAKLIEFNSGNIIDSLKQNSINDVPFPIAVEYSINIPFNKKIKNRDDLSIDLETEENINCRSMTIPNENKSREERKIDKKFPYIIYRKNLKEDIKPVIPNQKETNRNKNLIKQSYSVLINSVKEKLRQPKFSKELPEDKSTLWKYEINLDSLNNLEEEHFIKINEKIKKKEDEIYKTENDFRQFQLHDKNYIPNYINDLSLDKKDKMKLIINKKLKDVNLSYNKRDSVKNEIKKISKEKEHKGISLNKILNSNSNNKNDVNIFITPLKPIKSNILLINQNKEKSELPIIKERTIEIDKDKNNIKNNINLKIKKRSRYEHSPIRYNIFKKDILNMVNMSKEDKFREYKIQFDEKINEIKKPIEYFKIRKKFYNI